MIEEPVAFNDIPRALETYPSAADRSLSAELASRVQIEPFNAIGTGIFLVAILHTFAAGRFAALAEHVQRRMMNKPTRKDGRRRRVSGKKPCTSSAR